MKVAIETLGCKVNYYESEVIKSLFLNSNYQIVSLEESPDIVVINTCSVTNQSDAKDRKIIRKAKRMNKDAIIVVCGCYTQHAKEDLKDLEIDIMLGNKDKTKIVSLVEEYLKKQEKIQKIYDLSDVTFEDMTVDSTYDRTRAFIKIEDGCDNYCSYCIIPYVRGNVRFKEFDTALNEIKALAQKGFKEIVLTGIHTGRYPNLVKLIKEISKIDTIKRIRISSIEITEINTPEFLEELKTNPKLCDHMHIPVQNTCNRTLKMMNRKYDIETYMEIINNIKKVRPSINITTDFIVGFPTETNEDFEESLEIARKIKFGKIHVFPYSKRDGTAAAKMKNVVTEEDKKNRAHKLLALSDECEKEYLKEFIGKTMEILTEEEKDGYTYGYTTNYLRVKVDQSLPHNNLVEVKITGLDDLVLTASILGK